LLLDYNKLADSDVFISLSTAPQLRVGDHDIGAVECICDDRL